MFTRAHSQPPLNFTCSAGCSSQQLPHHTMASLQYVLTLYRFALLPPLPPRSSAARLLPLVYCPPPPPVGAAAAAAAMSWISCSWNSRPVRLQTANTNRSTAHTHAKLELTADRPCQFVRSHDHATAEPTCCLFTAGCHWIDDHHPEHLCDTMNAVVQPPTLRRLVMLCGAFSRAALLNFSECDPVCQPCRCPYPCTSPKPTLHALTPPHLSGGLCRSPVVASLSRWLSSMSLMLNVVAHCFSRASMSCRVAEMRDTTDALECNCMCLTVHGMVRSITCDVTNVQSGLLR